MEPQKSVVFITILLAVIAGFCDAVTFVSVDQLFSAHVTGNFIVFAYDLINHAGGIAWLKLVSFPVFILAVISGGVIAGQFEKPYKILLAEGIILAACGAVWLLLSISHVVIGEPLAYALAMAVVFSMGLQNAFGKLYPKETFGPTTMMTGNVTQAALAIGAMLKIREGDVLIRKDLSRQLITITAFLVGCLSGALLGKCFGLSAVLLPAIALVAFAAKSGEKARQ